MAYKAGGIGAGSPSAGVEAETRCPRIGAKSPCARAGAENISAGAEAGSSRDGCDARKPSAGVEADDRRTGVEAETPSPKPKQNVHALRRARVGARSPGAGVEVEGPPAGCEAGGPALGSRHRDASTSLVRRIWTPRIRPRRPRISWMLRRRSVVQSSFGRPRARRRFWRRRMRHWLSFHAMCAVG